MSEKTLDRMIAGFRKDGWENVLSGLGIAGVDKRAANGFTLRRLDERTAESLWSSDFGKIAVEAPVDAMMRAAFDLKISPSKEGEETEEGEEGEEGSGFEAGEAREDAFPQPPMLAPAPRKPPQPIEGESEVDAKVKREILAICDDLKVAEKFTEALKLARALGGSAILLGVDDGLTVDKPLDETRIREIKFLNVLSKYELTPRTYYNNPLAPKYGEVATYQINPRAFGLSEDPENMPFLTTVHASRLLVFQGEQTTRQAALSQDVAGWGASIFERVLEALQDVTISFGGAAAILQDFGQSVLKIKGLADLLMGEDAESDQSAIKRIQLMQLQKSTIRGVVIDAEEEYERKTTSLAGLPEVLDRLCGRLSAVLQIPSQILFGETPSGLNATGDAPIRAFYDDCAARNLTTRKPPLTRLLKLLFLAKQGPTKGKEPEHWEISFTPLWQPTDKEKQEARKITAETDKIYIDAGVLTAEEVARSRFGGAVYSAETSLDLEGRKEQQAVFEAEEAERVKSLEKQNAFNPKQNDLENAEA